MQIAFVTTRRSKPSYRFRIEQMLPEFAKRGHATRVHFLPAGFWSRLRLFRSLRDVDAVVLQKRLLGQIELRALRRSVHTLLYDIDDAVMLDDSGRARGRRAARFSAMCQTVDHVIAGNRYLLDLATDQGSAATEIPTCIDTDVFRPRLDRESPSVEFTRLSPNDEDNGADDHRIELGWTGSRSTNRYLNAIFPQIARFAERVRLTVVSDTRDGLDTQKLGDVPFRFVPWSPAVEVAVPARFDLGLMPLPDDPWTRGKCGFKALQYMGLGVAAIASAVGVNCEIISHQENGWLVTSPDGWDAALETLVTRGDLRNHIARNGRRRVEKAYSLHVQAPRLVDIVEQVVYRHQAGRKTA